MHRDRLSKTPSHPPWQPAWKLGHLRPLAEIGGLGALGARDCATICRVVSGAIEQKCLRVRYWATSDAKDRLGQPLLGVGITGQKTTRACSAGENSSKDILVSPPLGSFESVIVPFTLVGGN